MEKKMKIQVDPINNSYERLAVNLSELIHDLDDEQEAHLRDLLVRAYQLAYQKAAIEQDNELPQSAMAS